MTARRLTAAVLVSVLAVGCAASPAATSRSAESGASTAPGTNTVSASSPSLEDARRVAGEWVAATGGLLEMGPIARDEFIRVHVATASIDVMGGNLSADLAELADGLPMPVSQLRLVETPITIDASINPTSGHATVQVWSVVVFGAAILGPPRVLFRTSHLDLTVEAGRWKLTSFTATAGPTPIATDPLPADWDSFGTVAGWPPATAREG